MKRRLRALVGIALLALLGAGLVPLARRAAPRPTADQAVTPLAAVIRGQVFDERGPVAAARVRLRGSSEFQLTEGEGRFVLPAAGAESGRVTAWKQGYLISGAAWQGGPLRIRLSPLPPSDDAAYRWVDPTPDPAEPDNCGNCHGQIYDEWRGGGHANSAQNPRFLDLYAGTDSSGRPGGWSLLADHPHGLGVCAACHAPGIDFEQGAGDDMRQVTGVAAQGVHCDFCHKIQDVDDGQPGLAHGRFGYHLLRPSAGQLFFGPLDDVDRGEDAYSPLQHQSRYCAGCHEGIVFGVHVYSTYSEWLDSPARRQGRHCQSCHMEPTGSMTNIAPQAGGIERDPATLASHTLLPGGREAMLKRCIQVDVQLARQAAGLDCHVTLTARDVGHRVPTGFIDRHLLLVVEPRDQKGGLLSAESAPHLPPAAGAELADLPGRLLARLAVDASGAGPVHFWRATEAIHDTRLVPDEPSTTNFHLPAGTRRIRVRVLYRRFWHAVAVAKGWPDETITVYDRSWDVREAGL